MNNLLSSQWGLIEDVFYVSQARFDEIDSCELRVAGNTVSGSVNYFTAPSLTVYRFGCEPFAQIETSFVGYEDGVPPETILWSKGYGYVIYRDREMVKFDANNF